MQATCPIGAGALRRGCGRLGPRWVVTPTDSRGSQARTAATRQDRPNAARPPHSQRPGLTMISATLQLTQRRDSSTQRRRSALVRRGRLTERVSTPSWCRRARTSAANWPRVLKQASAAKGKRRMRFSTARGRGPVLQRPQWLRGARSIWEGQRSSGCRLPPVGGLCVVGARSQRHSWRWRQPRLWDWHVPLAPCRELRRVEDGPLSDVRRQWTAPRGCVVLAPPRALDAAPSPLPTARVGVIRE